MSLKEDIFIERYLRDLLSNEEKQSFLERMNNDTLFREKVLLEKQVFQSLNKQEWSFVEASQNKEADELELIYKQVETQKIKHSISKANLAYKKRKRNWLIYSVASMIAIILSVSIYKQQYKNNQELYIHYIENTELMNLVTRDKSVEFSNVQEYFNKKEYVKVSSILSKVIDTAYNGNVYLYLAISQMELNQYTEATQTLNKLINSNLIDAQKGYWYKSLLYLKANQIEKSKNELEIIIEKSYFKKEEAKELLRILK